MQIKTIHPINFLYYREETTLPQLYSFLERKIPLKLQQEAASNGFWITGPVYWNYFGFSGAENKPFMLEIALPVDQLKEDYKGTYHQRRADAFKCVTGDHTGDWMAMPGTYEKLFQFIQQQNLNPNGEIREIYINADFVHPEANITGINIGIE